MTIPVKLTRAHQVTLPKRLLKRAGWLTQEYFIADLKDDALILKPLRITSAGTLRTFADLRRHFARLEVTQRDVRDAVTWARQQEQSEKRPRQAKR